MEWFNLNLNGIEVAKTTEKAKLIKFVGGDFVGFETWVPTKMVKEGKNPQISFTPEFKFKVVKNQFNNETKKWEVVDEREVTGAEFAEHYKDNVIPAKA